MSKRILLASAAHAGPRCRPINRTGAPAGLMRHPPRFFFPFLPPHLRSPRRAAAAAPFRARRSRARCSWPWSPRAGSWRPRGCPSSRSWWPTGPSRRPGVFLPFFFFRPAFFRSFSGPFCSSLVAPLSRALLFLSVSPSPDALGAPLLPFGLEICALGPGTLAACPRFSRRLRPSRQGRAGTRTRGTRRCSSKCCRRCSRCCRPRQAHPSPFKVSLFWCFLARDGAPPAEVAGVVAGCAPSPRPPAPCRVQFCFPPLYSTIVFFILY